MSRIVEVTDRVTVRASQTTGEGYGPGTHEVPDDVADDLLSHRAVTEADQSDDDDADGSDSGESEDSGDFDAAAFVDQHHATVKNAVEDGDVDDHLSAVREAEEAREGGARDSVLQALQEREEQVQG